MRFSARKRKKIDVSSFAVSRVFISAKCALAQLAIVLH